MRRPTPLIPAAIRCRRALLCGLLAASALRAAVDQTLVSDYVVRDLQEEETRAAFRGNAPEQAARLRAEQRQRIELIRSLPSDRIQEWLAGNRSDAVLHRLAAAPRGTPSRPAAAPPFPEAGKTLPQRRARLLLALTGSLILGFLLWHRHSHP
ncbi:MAG: hypothetical protein RBT78_01065 [Kiritimatiellia bacterium]|jgi:hypothetical protein|nr:hypothetical protein [Kiritimatiellia bacterium]